MHRRLIILAMILALGWSILLWIVGRNPYFDNPFERQAYDEAP